MQEREPFNLPMIIVEEADTTEVYTDLLEATAKKLLVSQLSNRKSNELREEIKRIIKLAQTESYNKGLKDMDRMHSITNDSNR